MSWVADDELADDELAAEIARVRAAVARVRADPEAMRQIGETPPMNEYQRHVVAWAFRGYA